MPYTSVNQLHMRTREELHQDAVNFCVDEGILVGSIDEILRQDLTTSQRAYLDVVVTNQQEQEPQS